MSNRLKLHEQLVQILGTRNVYFQPPESINLNYPCIIYERDNINTNFADNKPYFSRDRYNVTVIDKDPDSSISERLLGNFSLCGFSRHYISDNLNHNTFILYY